MANTEGLIISFHSRNITALTKSFRILALVAAVNFAILLIIVGIWGFNLSQIKHQQDCRNKKVEFESNKSSVLVQESNHQHAHTSNLHVVTREEWIAQPPNKQNPKLKIPINRVIITHTATEGCYTQAQCVFRVRMIQSYHMDSKLLGDIGYNFLVGGDGSVYEGCGWHIQGAHTQHYNADSIGIAFIGTFTIKPPPQRQFEALKLILEEGVLTGNLTKDYAMYPHCAFIPTDSPGAELMEVIKSWPHYNGKLKFDCSRN